MSIENVKRSVNVQLTLVELAGKSVMTQLTGEPVSFMFRESLRPSGNAAKHCPEGPRRQVMSVL
jgi:hypothetical protein